jgi:hypothetical protein
MIVDEAAREAGLQLFRDAPPPGVRAIKKVMAKFIGYARKLEGEMIREIMQKDQLINQLQAKLASVREENEKHRLRERCLELELSEKDTRFIMSGKSA